MVLLAACAVVIAAGAGGAADSETWLDLPSFDWVSYVLLGLMALSALMIIVSVLTVGRGQRIKLPGKRKPMWPLVLLLLLFLAFSRNQGDEPEPEVAEPTQQVEEAEDTPQSRQLLESGGFETAVLLVIAAAAAAVILWSRRRADQFEEFDDAPLEAALTPAIAQASEHLSLGDDPRSAVLRAYDELEVALGSLGLARGLSETPTEHLRRVLQTMTVDTEPLVRLAQLYEVARFSERAISTTEQQQAATALRQVRSQMAALG